MNVITHFLTGWVLVEHSGLNHRDRSLVTWACVLPDADGLGVLPDLAAQLPSSLLQRLANRLERTVGA